jgi:PAS domain S-box-containing protein
MGEHSKPAVDEIVRLRRCLNDLSSTLALPALRTDGEPMQIAASVAEALRGMLELEFAFVRLNDPERGIPIDTIQAAESLQGPGSARELGDAIDVLLRDMPPHSGSRARIVVGGTQLSLASALLGIHGEIGIVVTGSERLDYPAHPERLLLDVCANQAAVALQHRLLREQQRVARELDRQVAHRTLELAAANRDLEKEVAERRRAEEALRVREPFRTIVDDLPVMVTLMTPDGEFEQGNRHMLEYFGASLEELKRRPTTWSFHPDDRPTVDARWKQSVETGRPYDYEARLRRADGTYRWFHTRGFPLRDAEGRIVLWHLLQTDVDDRKRAEDALRANERNLTLLIDTIPALAWSARPDGTAEFFNQHYLNFIGVPAEEASGWGWTAAVHPDDLDALTATWRQALASEQRGEAEARLRRHDGEYRWFLLRVDPLRNDSGAIVKWYGVNTDIEDRKRAEEELRRSEARKAAILDSALDCIVTIDHEGCITEFNHAAERAFGYRRDEVLGQQLADVIVPPALRQRHRQGFARYLTTGETRVLGRRIEMTALRADGSEFPAELAITRIPLDGPPSFTGYLREITERKRAEEKLRRSEAFLAEGQLLSRVGSFSWQVATDEIMWSEQLYRIFEIDRNVRVTFEVIGTRIHPEDVSAFKEHIERSRVDGSDVQLEIRLQMPNRMVKYIHVVAHCRHHGDHLEYIGAVQDVTERRLAEAALAKLRSDLAHVARVMSLGVFTASIAHEVNQPLAGIITNAGTCLRMLGGDPPDVDGARETARRTIRDGRRASDVITRLRELFSNREFTLEPLDLNEATREVIALSSNDLQRNRIILESELANDLPIITGNRIQLQQVVLNLLRNASEAMVEVHDRPRELLIKTEREHRDHVRLTVRDAGPGVPPQTMDSLFDAFFTTKSGGMGIGLFVSRSIVERHQGRLWAEPNDGPGATFSFSVPLDPASLSNAAPAQKTS